MSEPPSWKQSIDQWRALSLEKRTELQGKALSAFVVALGAWGMFNVAPTLLHEVPGFENVAWAQEGNRKFEEQLKQRNQRFSKLFNGDFGGFMQGPPSSSMGLSMPASPTSVSLPNQAVNAITVPSTVVNQSLTSATSRPVTTNKPQLNL